MLTTRSASPEAGYSPTQSLRPANVGVPHSGASPDPAAPPGPRAGIRPKLRVRYTLPVSEGEAITTVASSIIACCFWGYFLVRAVRVKAAVARPGSGRMVLFCIFAVGAVNLPVLRFLASADVRNAPEYIFMYLIMAYAAVALNMLMLRLLGWQMADVTERGNRAAAYLACGIALASACAFAGANIGDGPGFWVVLFCSGLSMLGLWLAIALHLALGRSGARILVERDAPFAFRFGCLMTGVGLVTGRSVAGDWTGYADAFVDFVVITTPFLVVVVLDGTLARGRPSPGVPASPVTEVVVGLVSLASAGFYLVVWGAP